MANIVALGGTHEIEGFALAGVNVVPTHTDAEARRAWEALGDDVGLVILSAAAADALSTAFIERPDLLTVVMP
jgi:vacuolar-type H+-ATPase subunit F/Vma7